MKPTVIDVWDRFTVSEKKTIAEELGMPLGLVALLTFPTIQIRMEGWGMYTACGCRICECFFKLKREFEAVETTGGVNEQDT